ncbi:MAG: oligosaccharide flippase family protein [Lachnospiraceae bacterium]|nr:oligosaccharide flippase family protein [Lachnospiraceae bacterium]
MSRVQQATKNIFFGYISNIVILIMGFLQRTVFIAVLGRTLLGVNGLYTDILSMLSLAELGIGTALNYSLYKPVANHDYEKIKSYMKLYKKAYLAIAGVISVIGLAVTPFLPYIIKDRCGITVDELTLYYLIFLFNTVSTYFVAYKYSLVNAEQRSYIQTNITTITKIVTALAQIIMLLVTKNFLVYLLTQAAVELLQKVAVSVYFNKLYPYLRDKNVKKLEKEETDTVVTKTKALMFHKIGDVARLSTDSIIITYFINVDAVGVVGNYTYIITYVSNFVSVIFNSVISGFGNLVATESKEKQYSIFKVYRFFACWMYGFASVGFWLLLTPLVTGLWLDDSWKLGQAILTLILIDFYFKGGRVVLINFKIAAGVFEQDKYLSLIQGAVNLVLSIIGAKYIGLAGVYIGTVISGVLANLIQPFIVYRDCFEQKVWSYFKDSLKYIGTILGVLIVLIPIKNLLMVQVNMITFILMAAVIMLIYNLVFFVIFRKTEEFGYLWDLFAKKMPFLQKIKK